MLNKIITTSRFAAAIFVLHVVFIQLVSSQLPDDIQRELNQNLAEQARIQALRQQHQQKIQQLQNRAGGKQKPVAASPPAQPAHDPNNYSYQQISPPIQYSYYQPYGDAAGAQQPQVGNGDTSTLSNRSGKNQGPTAADFDLNNLNFDMPQPQAQVSNRMSPIGGQNGYQNQQLVPTFTGAGGLPVMQPAAGSQSADSYAPVGQPPLAPQAQVQRGPPLTEADFKDITGGENYGAPGGNDFGIGSGGGAGDSTGNNEMRGTNGNANSRSDTDAQLREFGLPGGDQFTSQQPTSQRRGSQMNIPDFGAFGPIGSGMGMGGSDLPQSRQSSQATGGGSGIPSEFANFGGAGGNDAADLGGAGGGSGSNGGGANPQGDFDFASQPSSARGDQAAATMQGGAPGSLSSLLGSGFPGLGNGNGQSGLDNFAGPANDPQRQSGKMRSDDNAMDIADLGDKSDQFSGADLGGFEQPGPQNDQDFNYGSASNQQPKSVPYPDGNPQPVGTLWALTQPQSMTQTRYSAQIDKGTYQDYPAYQSGGNDFEAVRAVVDLTPRARRTGPGRYANPSLSELSPENRASLAPGSRFDYGQMPVSGAQVSRYGF